MKPETRRLETREHLLLQYVTLGEAVGCARGRGWSVASRCRGVVLALRSVSFLLRTGFLAFQAGSTVV